MKSTRILPKRGLDSKSGKVEGAKLTNISSNTLLTLNMVLGTEYIALGSKEKKWSRRCNLSRPSWEARAHGVSGARAHGVSRDLAQGPVRTGSIGPVDTGVPWARYRPVRTGCSSANFLSSPCARGLRGPWARGRLGGAELILLHSFFLLVALGSFSLASGMLPNCLVAVVLVPSDAQ